MKASAIAVLGSVLLSGAFLFAQQPSDDSAIKSPQAKAAIAKAERAEEAAKAAYRKALTDAKRTQIVELKAALAVATKAGNLDEANAIKAAIDSVEASLKADEAAKADTADGQGQYRVKFFGWADRLYEFDGRGNVRSTDLATKEVHEGKREGGVYVFKGRIERYTMAEGRLFVELFRQGKEEVAKLGVGEQINAK